MKNFQRRLKLAKINLQKAKQGLKEACIYAKNNDLVIEFEKFETIDKKINDLIHEL